MINRTQHLLQDSLEKLAQRQKEFEVNEVNFTKENNILAEKLSVSETKNDHLSKDLNEQRVKVSELHSTVAGLEQLVCVKEDVDKQLKTTQNQLLEAVEDKKSIRRQLEAVCISQDQISSKLLETEKAGNQLRQIAEEQDQEIEQLTATVIALRENMEVYVPAKVNLKFYEGAKYNSRAMLLIMQLQTMSILATVSANSSSS